MGGDEDHHVTKLSKVAYKRRRIMAPLFRSVIATDVVWKVKNLKGIRVSIVFPQELTDGRKVCLVFI